MRLPLNWLSEFVEADVSPEVLAERLTMAGFEVEAVETVAPDFAGVVVGRVTKVEPHPQADRLVVTEVEDGRRTYRVVCGAPDVTAGRVYAFGPPGARISGERELKAMIENQVVYRSTGQYDDHYLWSNESVQSNKDQMIMNTNQSNSILTQARVEQIPQMKIRSGLRGGASLETCEKALEEWKRSYYKHYEAAKYKSV